MPGSSSTGGRGAGLEVLLAHPGGPIFAKRDEGAWSIPKGEPDRADEPLLDVARREFAEETAHEVPDGPVIPLGSIVQKGGKVVHAWAVEGDLDPAAAHSNTFEMTWPPRSDGRIDRPGDRPGRVVRPGRGAPAGQGDADPAARTPGGVPRRDRVRAAPGSPRPTPSRLIAAASDTTPSSTPTIAGVASSAAARNIPVSDRASPCSSTDAARLARAGPSVVTVPLASPPTTRRSA